MNRQLFALVTLALAATTAAAAQQAEPRTVFAPLTDQAPADDPLARHLYPPELVMVNQRAIGLQEAQRDAILESVRYAQAVLSEFQLRMAGEMERLVELLRAPAVDSAASVGQLDRVLMHEHQVKRVHIAMLIRIRNVLTPDQRTRLDAIRSGRRS